MRLIDADALRADCNIYNAWDAQIVKAWLNDQPTIEERKTGRWECKMDGVYCSACHKGWDFIMGVPNEVETKYRYCPFCGSYNGGETE